MIRRRTFLAASAATALSVHSTTNSAMGSTKSTVYASEPTEKRFKKAVKIGMVNVKGTLTDKFQVLKDLGFDGVELDSPNNLKLEDVKAAIEATGLPVHGVVDSKHWNKTLSHESADIRKEGIDALNDRDQGRKILRS